MDLTVACTGDLHVDDHHTTEDVGICLGQAIDRALGDRAGIRRYGHAVLPMDETLVTCAVDLGGRPFWVWNAPMPTPKIGTFDSELVADFWQAVCHPGADEPARPARTTAGTATTSARRSSRAWPARSATACERDPRGEGRPLDQGVALRSADATRRPRRFRSSRDP